MERNIPIPPAGRSKYNVTEQFSALTGESLNTWYSDNEVFFIEKTVSPQDNTTVIYRVLPSTNDMALVGHIDFTPLQFEDFGNSIIAMGDLVVGPIQ